MSELLTFRYAPSFEQAKRQWFAGGRTVEGLAAIQSVIRAGRESGRLREDIPCDEFRSRFLDMAERVYVQHEPVASRPLDDLELGAHLAHCAQDNCQILGVLYMTVLRNADYSQSEIIADILHDVRDGVQLEIRDADIRCSVLVKLQGLVNVVTRRRC